MESAFARLFPRAGGLVMAAVFLALAGAVPAATLTLLTEENPPFNYSQDGKLTGMVTELVLETARRANVPVTVEVLPWSRAYTRAQAEKNTCLFATARLENRERLFIWIGPFANNLWAVYGKANFAGTVKAISDLKPYRIGGVAGDAKADYLRENGVSNIRQAVEDRANPPRLFLSPDNLDYIDLWVAGYFGARGVAREAKVGDIKRVFILREIPLFLACSPQTAPATIKALNEALEAIRAEGLPARAAAKYEKIFVE